MTGLPDRSSLTPPHLDDPQLVAYLDGQLPRAALDSARQHIDACWTCRSRLAEVLKKIDIFLESRASLQPEADHERDQRIRQFRELLARHAAEADAQLSFIQRLNASWRSALAALNAHRRAALATLAAACLLLAMFTDIWGTRVSADTVLARAAQYESSSHPQPGKVTRISVRVERIDRHSGAAHSLGVLSILQDSQTPAEFLSMQEPPSGERTAVLHLPADAAEQMAALALVDQDLPQPMAAFLETQQWHSDFSITAFRRLIAARGSSVVSAEKQANLFALHFPFAAGHESGISEVQLLVEARNYAPVALSFFTGVEDSGQEYRFTRTSMGVEPRSTEVARLFGVPDTQEKPRWVTAIREPLKAVPLAYDSSLASLEEVRLAEALHRADACLGEEIHLFPMSDGSLLVQGLVDDSGRRDIVRQALRDVDPTLHAQIYLPRELKSGSQLFPPPYKLPASATGTHPSDTTLADLSSEHSPIYEELYHHFSKPGVSPEEAEKQTYAFSSEAVTLARQTFLHAWALKKLDEEFPSRRTLSLPAPALQQIERMRQDHRRWIATLSHHQAEMLSQVLPVPPQSLSTDTLARTSDGSDALIRLAQEQNELVRSLFTVSDGAAETQSTLARLLAILHRMGA